MSPETVVDRLRCYLRWNASRIAALDDLCGEVPEPACYTRGRGDKAEYLFTSAMWQNIFPDDYNEGAQKTLYSLGLLRRSGDILQVYARINGKLTKVYAVSGKIVSYEASTKGIPGYRNGESVAVSALPAISPPVMPANFNSLPPSERQDYLLAASMYLQSQTAFDCAAACA